MKKLLILISIWLGIAGAQQNYRFDHLSFEEGITHNITYSIIQDSKGFMWFGTFYGLIRYDGRDYKIFKHIPFDSTSVSSDNIISLYEDKNGFIWVGTWSGGLNRFDPHDEVFTQYKHEYKDTLSISNDVVFDICEDISGQLWVATEKGLNRFIPRDNPGNNTGRDYFVRYLSDQKDPNSLNNNNIRTLFRDDYGRLWIGVMDGGLHIYNPSTDNFIRLEEITRDGSSSTVDIFEDKQKNIWVATWGGGLKKVNVIENEQNQVIGLRIKRFYNNATDDNSISSNFIYSLEQDESGNLWIGTIDGLNYFNPQRMTFERFYNDRENTNSISSNKISTIRLDNSGVLWLGTFRGSIDRIVPGLARFEHFLHNPFDPKSLIDKKVTALTEDNRNVIWAGTENGISLITEKDGTYRYKNFLFSTKTKNKLDDYITAFVQGPQKKMWIGTHNGLKRINENYDFEQFNLPLLAFENERGNIITSLLLDHRGLLWVGTITHGLTLFNPTSKIFTSFTHNNDDSTSISSNYVVSLYEDGDGSIWVGTYSGLNKIIFLSPSTEQPQIAFQRKLRTAKGYLNINDNVFSMLQDAQKNFWIGTINGLIKYNPENLTVIKYHVSDGLPDNLICGILEDDDTNIWFSTMKGIAKFNQQNNRFINYNTLYGLQSNVFSAGVYCKKSDGKLMFGGSNGFNSFYPENITSHESIPKIVLTSFRVFDKEKSFEKRLQDLKTIELNYRENFFTFKFAAMDFRMPERNQFYYFLEGYDRDWIYNETKNSASYSNLEPGEYTFRVKGSNSNGVWNDQGTFLKLIIVPPFWQTWWFRTLIIIIIISLLVFIIHLVYRSEQRKTEFNKRIAELKLQALRAQMNPHFIFNTINSIQYFISCNDQKSAFLYLSKFSQLMRQTLDNSARSSISIKKELETLQLYMDLQKLRFENRFDYSLKVDPKIDVHNFEIPAMLIQPYIENAINHGIGPKKGKGNIDVSLSLKDNFINCIVEDDGIGINKAMNIKKKKSADHTSAGMRLTNERLQIINYGKVDEIFVSVMDRSENGSKDMGTRVTINIPLKISIN
jgi:ligand-binding sensor domain-containing protein